MKKTNSASPVCTAILAIASFLFFSCKEDNPDPAPAANTFTWTYSGTTYTASLDSAYEASVPFNPYYIVAINGTNFNTSFTRKIAFSLTSFAAGTYTVSTSTNKVYYVNDAGSDLFGTSGTITISSYSNNRLSGSFSCTLTGGVPVSGSFTNVPVRP